jgi:hypothetical protein
MTMAHTPKATMMASRGGKPISNLVRKVANMVISLGHNPKARKMPSGLDLIQPIFISRNYENCPAVSRRTDEGTLVRNA